METKIQELTDKLFLEGVEKGKVEADRIIEEAQNRRKTILDETNEETKKIVENAQKQAADFKKNTEAEIKLYAAQAIDALKSEITNLITHKLAAENVNNVFNTPDFMYKLIIKLVSDWQKNEQLTICTEDANGLKVYFETNAKQLLDKGVKIEQINGKKHTFTLAPKDGSYKINFGEEEFVEYFKEFLRPQLIDLLF